MQTELIAKYLDIMEQQQQQINSLSKENIKLNNLHKDTKARATQYKSVAKSWKQAYDDLLPAYNETSKILHNLVELPDDQILRCINKYKENM